MLKNCIITLFCYSLFLLGSCSKYDLSIENPETAAAQDSAQNFENKTISVHFHGELSDQYFSLEILDPERTKLFKIYKAASSNSLTLQDLIPQELDSFYLHISDLPFLELFPNDSTQIINIYEANGKSWE